MATWRQQFGARLQNLRGAAGLSQPQLAERAGVSVGTLRGWEQGRREPLAHAAAALAAALGVPADVLLGLGGPSKPKKGCGK